MISCFTQNFFYVILREGVKFWNLIYNLLMLKFFFALDRYLVCVMTYLSDEVVGLFIAKYKAFEHLWKEQF